ncbi:lysosomal L-cystine transporter-like protein [Mollisia scopiformis]|uniref:Lysosomal L-cystine transporter-like protein n=1 Tax=Mollisia scopiformis TaxID=149040 RepID=A0A132BDG6_MOLSC|nr:lysosomal L-cystine transporter-like protein [Mollisia scopiformis]KUJ10029.1 lysosomal L-cystine transporter-like protein [Mollisia scopiformis]
MAFSFLEVVSELCGWVYTICWSLSFYPQPLLNFRRKSTTGTTIDFPAINVLGFVGYFISNAAFLYSPLIRKEYASRNHGLTPTVQFNDFAFAAHAIVLSAITLSQFLPSLWGFEERGGPGARPSRFIMSIFVGSILGVLIVILIVIVRNDPDPATGWAWIDVIYAFSYVKLFITLVKYMPQVLTNYRNRSTQGWSIGQILLDVVGGILSIIQLGIDSYLQGDRSGITGNPVKLMLGNISILFDIIFMTQHYCLYPGYKSKELLDGEDDPLLGDRERRID